MIRLLITDCDGVLTPKYKWYTEDGKLIKRFVTRDMTAVRSFEQLHGVPTYVLSGDDRVNKKFCEMHRLGFAKSVTDKPVYVGGIAAKCNVQLCETVYIGDDVPDVEAGKLCGFFFAPQDADPYVLEHATSLPINGGEGVIAVLYNYLKKNHMLQQEDE